jgi:fatty acid elongase 3
MSATPATFYEQLPLPTIDRPFGIHLWPIFDKAFTAVVGYSANDFKFVPFETPMSTIKSTSIFIAIYYCIIFGGREWMRNREPFKLKGLFLIHNLYLTLISGALLALFIEQLLPTVTPRVAGPSPLSFCTTSTTLPSTSSSLTPSSSSSRRSL